MNTAKGTESSQFAGPLLTLDQIAAAFHVSRNHARDVLVKRADFPRPAFALSQKCKRWKSEDVFGWIERQRLANLR